MKALIVVVPEHSKKILEDVGHHSRRVTLDNPVMSVVAFGLKNDDIITVTSTKVVVPLPSRETLLRVKTAAWRSEAPSDGVKRRAPPPIVPFDFGPGSVATKATSPLAGPSNSPHS